MITVTGYIDHIIFQNADNGYTVFVLINQGEEITCVGNLHGITQGENVSLQGDYVEHAVYGTQFKADSYQVIAPTDRISMERYLGSGAIKGIGPALAARIVKKFGDETFRIVEEEPERLAEIKGISLRKAQEIGIQAEEKKDMREAMVFLQKYGISNALAVKIYDTYKNQLYTVLNENPYQMAEDIEGVGFRIADSIAMKIGIHTDSDFRIRSGILYALKQAVAEGHSYLPESMLTERAAQLLEIDKKWMEGQIDNLMIDRKIIVKEKDGERIVFHPVYYYAELSCARMLHDLNISLQENGGLLPAEETALLKKIDEIARNAGMELEELQKEAVLQSICNGLLILSGGPGTGKTTTINTIIRFFEAEGLDILLAAPTGRAAKRMTETTGYESRTIHRMLELNGALTEASGKKACFERNEEHPLEADVIIVDEMSMVDLPLFQALLKAVMPGTRLILVGDVNQLPSVGPGQILKDIIDSKVFPVVMLQKIFRQSAESDIVVNAHRIHRGEQIRLDNKSKDFFLLERNDINVIYKHMVLLMTEKLPPYVNADAMEIQVLTPMRKGSLGVETLNKILQEYLNPPSEKKKEYHGNDILFREGDKVMQVKNNYQLEWEVLSRYSIPIDKGMGVFNGDMGRIVEINEFSAQLTVEFDEKRRVTYPFQQLDELELAYAVTIHKSQGSEYPAVILPLLTGPKLLFNRNLLYTAVTRAKHCVTILGSSETVRSMINNERENRRFTALGERIHELSQGDSVSPAMSRM